MGNWAIHIEGVGCHGNRGADFDAETIAQRCVRDLIRHGHDVSHSTVTSGGAVAIHVEGRSGADRSIARSDGFDTMPVLPDTARARRLYEVYCESSGAKNFRGDPCPAWDELPEAIRTHWTAVAVAAAR